MTRLPDPNTSPFPVPPLECRNCGRIDRHVYCERWLERLRLLFGGQRL